MNDIGQNELENGVVIKKKWYQKGWIIALLLYFCWPVGLYLMWKHSSWSKVVKWGISAIFILAFLAVGVELLGYSSSNDADIPETTNTVVTTQETVTQTDENESSSSVEPVQKTIRGQADAPLESEEYLLYYIDSNSIKLHDFVVEDERVNQKIDELLQDDNNRYYVTIEDGVWKTTKKNSPYGYIGEVKNGKPDGIGTIVDLSMYYDYDMEFIHYIGEFTKGMYDGYGKVYNTPSEDLVSMYCGYVSREKLNTALNHLLYSGQFNKGELSGKGNYFIYTPDDGLLDYYNVNPTEAKMEAFFELSDKNGVYGMFVDSMIMHYQDENVEFSFDAVDIPMDTFYKNIKIVVGEFKNNDLNGNVKVYCYGKLLYEGEMRSGMYDGYGTLYYYGSNQKYYEGTFDEGDFSGKGDLYSIDGERL